MKGWSLPILLSALHDGVAHRLQVSRDTMAHSVLKGDASEAVWLNLLQTYLPVRYQAARAVVIDSENNASEQLDVVVFDRQYLPFVFQHEGITVIPAESVYAASEASRASMPVRSTMRMARLRVFGRSTEQAFPSPMPEEHIRPGRCPGLLVAY